jgi:hypothetical protein
MAPVPWQINIRCAALLAVPAAVQGPVSPAVEAVLLSALQVMLYALNHAHFLTVCSSSCVA